MLTFSRGGWNARIVGPQCHITGPRGITVQAQADTLRRMMSGKRASEAQREVFRWAIGKMEAGE